MSTNTSLCDPEMRWPFPATANVSLAPLPSWCAHPHELYASTEGMGADAKPVCHDVSIVARTIVQARKAARTA